MFCHYHKVHRKEEGVGGEISVYLRVRGSEASKGKLRRMVRKELLLLNTTTVSFNGVVYLSGAFLNNIFGAVLGWFFLSQNKLLCEAEVEAAGSVIFSPSELHPLACLLYSFDISLNHIATDQK